MPTEFTTLNIAFRMRGNNYDFTIEHNIKYEHLEEHILMWKLRTIAGTFDSLKVFLLKKFPSAIIQLKVD